MWAEWRPKSPAPQRTRNRSRSNAVIPTNDRRCAAMKTRFSQRIGVVPVRDKLQLEGMDKGLRVALWNYIESGIFHFVEDEKEYVRIGLLTSISTEYLHNRFKKIEGYNSNKTIDEFHAYFLKAQWYEVYDFIEHIVEFAYYYSFAEDIDMDGRFNEILEGHMSGYRFIDYVLSPIIDEQEIDSIEEAISNPNHGVSLHLQTALEFLSDRQSPNYRNSVRESITAVEALVRLTTEEKTLGKGLNAIEKSGKFEFNTQFKSGLEKIYAYTNNEETGIRHTLIADDAVEVTFDDAKFMLVLCSAFVNYVHAKNQNV